VCIQRRDGEGKEDAAQALPRLIAKARISFKRRQEKEEAKPKKPQKPKVAKVDQLWFVLVTEKFPRCVPPLWDAKHKSLAKHLINRIGGDQIGGFIKWAIENWTAVIQTSFKWMTTQTQSKNHQRARLLHSAQTYLATNRQSLLLKKRSPKRRQALRCANCRSETKLETHT
jgi:hypothetical protein